MNLPAFALAADRKVFVSMRVPDHAPSSTCYLSTAQGLGLSAESAIKTLDVAIGDFRDPTDINRAMAQRLDTVLACPPRSLGSARRI